jgi:hypothetical protein
VGRFLWLVLRRGGCLWGIRSEHVRRVSGSGDGFRVRVGDAELAADEVLRVHLDLTVRPAGPIVRGLVPPGSTGLGLCEHGPVLVIDPDCPPAVLAAT